MEAKTHDKLTSEFENLFWQYFDSARGSMDLATFCENAAQIVERERCKATCAQVEIPIEHRKFKVTFGDDGGLS